MTSRNINKREKGRKASKNKRRQKNNVYSNQFGLSASELLQEGFVFSELLE
jgi:hypothetical protein